MLHFNPISALQMVPERRHIAQAAGLIAVAVYLSSAARVWATGATITVPANTTAGTVVTDISISGRNGGNLAAINVTDDGAFTTSLHGPSSIVWTLDGAALAPGQSTKITVTGAAGTTIQIDSWSWKDSSGAKHHGTELPDPVGCTAVFGGPTGTTYLGVFIPADKWGYFYQVYNSGGTPIKRARFVNRAPQSPSDFVVLPQAFTMAYLQQYGAAFDPETQTLRAFDYMTESQAVSTGIAPSAWFFDENTGQAVAEFATPLSAGQTSSLFGFIADAGPHDVVYDVNETVQLFSADETPICPLAQNGLVPTAPATPIPTSSPGSAGAMALLVLAAALLVLRRRKASAAFGPVCLGVILWGAASARGLPPGPEEADWNENASKLDGTQAGLDSYEAQLIARYKWNCYNYALNKKTTDAMGKPTRAHPGKGQAWAHAGAVRTAAQMCDKVKARAIADGLTWLGGSETDPIPTPPAGENLVVLVVMAGRKFAPVGFTGDRADYHWWRKNGDGTWSHKRGSSKAKTTYTDGAGMEQTLSDPRVAAQRDGYDFCGFMSVKKDPQPDIGPLAAATPRCGPRTDGTWVAALASSSGPHDAEMALSPSEALALAEFLPTFEPGNQVSDPQWVDPHAGEPAGFVMFNGRDSGVSQLPRYFRVFNGVVEVFFGTLSETGNSYYLDDRGLEAYLQATFNPESGACCSTAGCNDGQSECACDDSGGNYFGSDTVCTPENCPAVIPAAGDAGLGAMTLTLLVAALILIRRRLGTTADPT